MALASSALTWKCMDPKVLFFQISQHQILSRSHWQASLVPTRVAVSAQCQDTNWWQRIKLLWQHLLINTAGLSFARQKSSASICSCKAIWKVTNFCNQVLCECQEFVSVGLKDGLWLQAVLNSLRIHTSAQTRAMFPGVPFPFLLMIFMRNHSPARRFLQIVWMRYYLCGGGRGKCFISTYVSSQTFLSKHVCIQYAQVLDNAEVVTHFAAKLSVAQQARNGELRSCTCLAWLKPIYEAGNSLTEL